MEINEYMTKALSTCKPTCDNFTYMFLNLVSEVGEFAGKIAKARRKDEIVIFYDNLRDWSLAKIDSELEKQLKLEAGDIFWQLVCLCHQMGWTAEEVCQMNLDKLADRDKRNVIIGEGDER